MSFVSVQQLARILSVTPRAVDYWASHGMIPTPEWKPVRSQLAYTAEQAEEITQWFVHRMLGGEGRGPGVSKRRQQARQLARSFAALARAEAAP